jgi:hypothetical protein
MENLASAGAGPAALSSEHALVASQAKQAAADLSVCHATAADLSASKVILASKADECCYLYALSFPSHSVSSSFPSSYTTYRTLQVFSSFALHFVLSYWLYCMPSLILLVYVGTAPQNR